MRKFVETFDLNNKNAFYDKKPLMNFSEMLIAYPR